MYGHKLTFIFDQCNVLVWSKDQSNEATLTEVYNQVKDPFTFLERSLKVQGVNVVGTQNHNPK